MGDLWDEVDRRFPSTEPHPAASTTPWASGGWKLKRLDEEWPIGSAAVLVQWGNEGRVRPDDYVFNPVLERWMYARDVAELAPVFGKAKASSSKRMGCSVAILGLVLCLLWWPVGVIVMAAGLVIYGMAEHKEKSRDFA